MNRVRVCVTGAAGFIGNHLCRYLQERGYWVRGVDWKEPRFGDVAANEVDWDCDLRDQASADRALRGVDQVYALAADMGGAGFVFTGENDLQIMRNNTLINLNTLDAACLNDVGRYLFTSSACIYPKCLQRRTCSESLAEHFAYPASPDSEYGWEKLYAERLCQTYGKSTDLQTRIARLHNIYGPAGSWNDGREKLPAAACRKVAEAKSRAVAGEPPCVEVWGDGQARRSFCYIDDCLEMLYRLMWSDHSLPINIGTDRSVSVDDVFDIVAEIAGVEIEKVYMPGPQGVRGRNADLSLMRKVLEYEPQVSLEKGLRHAFKWVSTQVAKKADYDDSDIAAN